MRFSTWPCGVEIIMDFRIARSHAHTPIYINRAVIECMSSFEVLGIHISDDLTWSLTSSTLVKKAQQRLYFLRSRKLTCDPVY